MRAQFVAGFQDAAKSGLQVGAGQTGVAVRLPPGSPPGLLQRIAADRADVFTHGFVDAMRGTMVMPVAVMLLAAASCLAIKQRKRTGAPTRRPRRRGGTPGPGLNADLPAPPPAAGKPGHPHPPAQLAGSSSSCGHSPGSSSWSGSNGNRAAKAGSRSDSQVAAGSNLAKNGLPTRLGSRAWIMCRTNTFSPATSVIPSTHTLPGVADIDGPRTVRHRPDTLR